MNSLLQTQKGDYVVVLLKEDADDRQKVLEKAR